MERGDVARLLSVADADVESFEENEHGLFVTVRDGGRRVVTKDGLFACDGHPANAQLRRWVEPAGEAPPVETVDPDTHADVPDGTAAEVLAWVDGDAERALLAYAFESAREKPRSTLLAKLDELVSA
jgi:hypothetical protein